MEFQDWTPVVLKRRPTKREAAQASSSGISEVKDSQRNERSRLAKMDMMDYSEAPKKRIESESIPETYGDETKSRKSRSTLQFSKIYF
jgi:hypothetical protein